MSSLYLGGRSSHFVPLQIPSSPQNQSPRRGVEVKAAHSPEADGCTASVFARSSDCKGTADGTAGLVEAETLSVPKSATDHFISVFISKCLYMSRSATLARCPGETMWVAL